MASLLKAPAGNFGPHRPRIPRIDVLEAQQVEDPRGFDSSLASFLIARIGCSIWMRHASRIPVTPACPFQIGRDRSGRLARGSAGHRQELTGFVVLNRAPAPLDLNWEARDILKMAGTQLAVHPFRNAPRHNL